MSFRKSEYFKTTRITVVFAVAAIAISIIVLSGWVFDFEVLTSIHDEWVSLKVNAAIATIFAVSSLLMFTSGRKKGLASFLAVVTYLIGFVTLSEYLFDWNAHIDELLFKDTKTAAELYPGRMAPLAAIGFILLRISLLFFHYKKKQLVADVFAIIVLTVSFLALIGYMYNAKSFYTISYFNSISVSATLVLFFLSLAILFSKPESGLMAVFSEKTRPVMLGAMQILSLIIILLALGWLCLKGYEAGYYDMKFGVSIMVVSFSVILFFTSTAGIRNLNTIENERDSLYKANEEKATQIKDVFERVSDAFIALDKNWQFVYVNKKAGELSKRNPADIIGKNIWEEFPGAVGSDTYKACHKAMTEQQYISNTDYNGLLDLWYENNIYPSPEGLSIFIRDINEIKKAEKALEESANHLRTIYETEPECIKLLGPGGELLEMNSAGLAMIEADNLEMVKGKSIMGIIAPKYRDEFARLTQNVFKGESGILEFEITGLKGTYRFLETHAVPLKDDSGKIISLLSVTRDITERSKAKEAILKSERRYQTLTEVSPVGIFHTDANGNTTYVNPRWCQISGLSFENALGNGWFNAVHEEDRDTLISSWHQATKNQELSLSEYRFVRPDGTIAWVMGQAFPERNLENQIVGYVGTTTDITERKLAEDEFRRSEKKLREITASLPGVVYQFSMGADGKTEFRFLSDGINKYLDINVEDIYKDNSLLFSTVHPDDIGRLLTSISLSNKNLEPLTIVYRILIRGGIYIWVRSDSIPVLQEDGTILRNGSIIDVTATKEAEESLQKSDTNLKDAQRIAHIGSWDLDLTNNVLNWTDEIYRIFEIDPKRFGASYETFLNIIHPEDREMVNDAYIQSVKNKGVYDIEHRLQLPDGRIKYVHEQCKTFYDETGTALRSLGTVQDISERKEATEKLNIAHKQLLFHIENTPLGYIEWDNQLFVKSWSKKAEEIFGWNEREFIEKQKNGFSLVYEEDVTSMNIVAGQLMEGSLERNNVTHRNYTKDGKVIWCEWFNSVLKDKDGKAVTIMSLVQDVTERKLAEEKIKESEAKYRSLMQQAGDSIVLFSGAGQLIDANESARRLLGYSAQEYKKMSLRDFFFDEDLTKNPLRFDLLNKGESTISRRRLKRKGGAVVETEIHASKLSDGNYLAVARDLTERIKAERKLFEKDQQLREISSTIPGFIYQFALEPTGEFHFPFISESARTLIGVSPEEVYENVGNAFAKVHPDDIPGLFESIYTSANSLTPWLYIFKIIDVQDKITRWIRGNSVPKKMENGSIIWNGAMFDITELKLAEEKIKESEGKYRNMVERNLAGIYQTSYEGKILTCNEAFARMLGYTSNYLQQQNAEILYFSKTGRNEFITRIQRTGEIFNHEIKLKHSDGSSVYMIENCYLHTNPQTGEQIIEGVVIDITKRKKAEQELEESYKSIRRLTEYLQEVREEERTYIAREIHDELGQQLTVMMMDVAWLNKKIGTENVGVSDKIKELLEMLDNTVKTVRRISTELRPSLLDDLGLVAAMEMHLKDFETRSAILTQLTVPKQDLELADSVKNTLFRIFQESLTNVARHSGAEKVVAMLEVNDDNIVLTIEDNGKGFDEREAATKKTLGVLGMKERAAVIGGEYQILGKPGKGTTIQIRVPLHY